MTTTTKTKAYTVCATNLFLMEKVCRNLSFPSCKQNYRQAQPYWYNVSRRPAGETQWSTGVLNSFSSGMWEIQTIQMSPVNVSSRKDKHLKLFLKLFTLPFQQTIGSNSKEIIGTVTEYNVIVRTFYQLLLHNRICFYGFRFSKHTKLTRFSSLWKGIYIWQCTCICSGLQC